MLVDSATYDCLIMDTRRKSEKAQTVTVRDQPEGRK